jgi:glyoxylate reductase
MRVLVTQPIDPAGLQVLLAAGLETDVFRGKAPMPRDQLLARVEGAVGLLPMLTDRVDGEVLDRGPLRVVANHAVGVDNIDLVAAKGRGVVVTNTPGVLTDATADLTWALLLACARHVVPGDRMMREDRFTGWTPLLFRGPELRGATLGIVGMGRIGRAVADRAEGFGMEVIGSTSGGGLSFAELLERSDVLSLHCPLTPETRGLVDGAALAAMKPTALLLNTARGPIVDEDALAEALRSGRIAGAGLDVHADEPRAHPGLRALENVVLLPHLGSATVEARRKMAVMAAEGLVAALHGERPAHPVRG